MANFKAPTQEFLQNYKQVYKQTIKLCSLWRAVFCNQNKISAMAEQKELPGHVPQRLSDLLGNNNFCDLIYKYQLH
jgi:hypothetical protein